MKKREFRGEKKKKPGNRPFISESSSEFLINANDIEIKVKENKRK